MALKNGHETYLYLFSNETDTHGHCFESQKSFECIRQVSENN